MPQIEEISKSSARSRGGLALRAERMVQERKLRDITLKIQMLSKRGGSVRGRIGASLKGRFGFDSLLLIQFGFTPRKTVQDREAKLATSSWDVEKRSAGAGGEEGGTRPPRTK